MIYSCYSLIFLKWQPQPGHATQASATWLVFIEDMCDICVLHDCMHLWAASVLIFKTILQLCRNAQSERQDIQIILNSFHHKQVY